MPTSTDGKQPQRGTQDRGHGKIARGGITSDQCHETVSRRDGLEMIKRLRRRRPSPQLIAVLDQVEADIKSGKVRGGVRFG